MSPAQPMTRNLSKSKILAFRQCPKRVWLEIHRPELREDSAAAEARFSVGNAVGEMARRLYDPAGKGSLIDAKAEGHEAAFNRTQELLQTSRPIFEAGFTAGGALAFADVMLPVRKAGRLQWRMVEVKSTSQVKDYHHDDAAVQSFVARSAGVPLASIALACIDTSWVYPGGGNYAGLFKEHDMTAELLARGDEVQTWIQDAQVVASRRTEPKVPTGAQCNLPFECGFFGHCSASEPTIEYPVRWLPKVQTKALKTLLADSNVKDLRQVPDDLLNDRQLRVKHHTLADEVYFDAPGARADLARTGLPAYFMDFETVNLAVPIWKGTRPYQQIPFQFSVHRMARNGRLSQESFLDLSRNDPSKAFAQALVAACGDTGPVFVYNAGFERSCVERLAERVPKLAKPLRAINDRLVDLQVVAANRYYHPSQQGSWSIKDVLPALVPRLRYDALEGVQDGTMAIEAYQEAIDPATSAARKAEIERELLAYCSLDTLAMVKLWEVFTGRAAKA